MLEWRDLCGIGTSSRRCEKYVANWGVCTFKHSEKTHSLAAFTDATLLVQIIYYNEAVPVLTQDVDLWGNPLGYGNIPASIDWLYVHYSGVLFTSCRYSTLPAVLLTTTHWIIPAGCIRKQCYIPISIHG
jgi:hypothetical protein